MPLISVLSIGSVLFAVTSSSCLNHWEVYWGTTLLVTQESLSFFRLGRLGAATQDWVKPHRVTFCQKSCCFKDYIITVLPFNLSQGNLSGQWGCCKTSYVFSATVHVQVPEWSLRSGRNLGCFIWKYTRTHVCIQLWLLLVSFSRRSTCSLFLNDIKDIVK